MKYEGSEGLPKETIIQKEEYGTIVDKEKKNMKKKNKERERPK